MYINGHFDTSFDHDYLAVPAGLTFPAAVAKLVTEYEAAFLKHDASTILLEEALATVIDAEAEDTLALVAAVAAGEPHPGTPAAAKAASNKAYRMEATRQAATAANQLADRIRAAVIDNRNDLLSQAIPVERERHAAFVAAFAEAKAIIDAAGLDARTIGASINWITQQTDGPLAHSLEVMTPSIFWPSPHQLAAQQVERYLSDLEATISDPNGMKARAEATAERLAEDQFNNLGNSTN
jgi:hypothetical protein